MQKENITNALSILAMLRPDVEEAQRIIADEAVVVPQRAKLAQTLAGVERATDTLERLLSAAVAE